MAELPDKTTVEIRTTYSTDVRERAGMVKFMQFAMALGEAGVHYFIKGGLTVDSIALIAVSAAVLGELGRLQGIAAEENDQRTAQELALVCGELAVLGFVLIPALTSLSGHFTSSEMLTFTIPTIFSLGALSGGINRLFKQENS